MKLIKDVKSEVRTKQMNSNNTCTVWSRHQVSLHVYDKVSDETNFYEEVDQSIIMIAMGVFGPTAELWL